ncbi:MAG: chromosome segregation protein SMC [Candidatus Micrarchaeota archaeon]|nr:chromosome segregation protein SMC [Candidatus Micrarchaeota archaeon]
MSGAFISKLRCRNFKSFKKVDVNLINGFQAFMGPNGSGKSNVCDAIRFAIGEMKFSALRAKSIKDLINHNAEHAEVCLEISTPDGEITVARRITRDGKSGYKLNGKNATRGAVIELLKKYNIENGTHNVIGQGEVQKIIEMNAVEKRKIIDEIAGVAEFDAKKNEAMKELETVQQRINDTRLILKEKEGYIKELEKDREIALKYIALRKEVTNLKNSVIYWEIRRVEEEYEGVTKEYAIRKAKISEIDGKIAEIDERIREKSQAIRELSEEINRCSTDNKAFREYEALRTELAVSAEKKENLILKKKELAKRLGELQAKKSELESRIASFGTALSEKEQRLLIAKSELAELKRKADMAKKRDSTLVNESQKLGEEIKALEDEIYSKEEILRGYEGAALQAEIKLTAKMEEMEKLTQAAEKGVSAELREIERKIREAEKELEKKKKEVEDLFIRERKINEQSAEADKALLKLKEEYSRYRAISGMSHTENVISFVKDLQEKGAVKGIYGTVQELCNFDSKYAVAIEASAGSRLNYFVVEDVETCNEVIEQLRARKMGRATFLPLKMTVEMQKPQLNYPGVLGRLIDFIEYDPKFAGPMMYVFGDTVLVSDIESAKDVGLIGKARLVTLAGDVIEKSSAVTGGYFVSGMKLAERKKAAELEEKIAKLQEEKEGLVSSLFQLRDESSRIRRERAEIEVLIKSLQVDAQALAKNASEVEECRARIKLLKEEISQLERAKRENAAEIEKMMGQAAKAKEKLAVMRQRKSEIDSVLYKREEGNEEKISVLQDEVAMLEAEFKGSTTEVMMLKRNIEDISAQIGDVEVLSSSNDSDIKALEERMVGIEKDMEKKKKQMEKASEDIRELVQRRDAVQKDVDKLAVDKGGIFGEKERMLQELGKIETRKAVLEQRLVDLKSETTNEEFELIEGNLNRMKGELKEKETELAAIGNVNLNAPAMYDERKKEADEMSEKLALLEKERDAVIQMINEVEKRKIAVFMEAFEKVNMNFQSLFSQTFASGKAHLALQDQKDPFEGGLDVRIIREDGRQERLESLSGGEKSVIAILLVFAIHMYHPSAFYILDEIESALDKIRSKLVSDLIKKLSQKTQFIVVSHNDVTLSSADAVMGVSKVHGISQVVSLQLNKPMMAAEETKVVSK